MKPVEALLTKSLYALASRSGIPLSGTFELSPVCNFSCRMCYVRKTPAEVRQHTRPMMTLEEWLNVAEAAKAQGMLYLLLTGGEPLLWPDFWELYDRLIDMGLLISINTNGSLIDEDAIDHFRKKPPMRINITLYGASDQTYLDLCGVHGVYTRVVEAICGLRQIGIPVKVNCSLTPHNIKDFPWMAEFAEKHQLVLDATSYMYPPIRRDSTLIGVNERFTPEEAAVHNMERVQIQYGENSYQMYLKEILAGTAIPPGIDESCIDPMDGKVRCRAGKASFWITWDGYMTPCGMMIEPKQDVRSGFDTSWSKIMDATAQITLSGICDKCDNHSICQVCAAMAYAETGAFSKVPVYLCKMVAAMKKAAAEQIGDAAMDNDKATRA